MVCRMCTSHSTPAHAASSPASILDPRTLDSMEVHAAALPAEFGDRISAVIDARSTRPEADRYYERA